MNQQSAYGQQPAHPANNNMARQQVTQPNPPTQEQPQQQQPQQQQQTMPGFNANFGQMNQQSAYGQQPAHPANNNMAQQQVTQPNPPTQEQPQQQQPQQQQQTMPGFNA